MYSMRRFKIIFLILIFLLSPVMMFGQASLLQEIENIFVTIKDIQGNRLEGYLQSYPDEILVSTEDGKQKSIPFKMIESIKVEKISGGLPGPDELKGKSYYSVRLQNSQEVYTLKKKYTFQLKTSLGVVTKILDPEALKNALQQNIYLTNGPEDNKPLIRDKSAIISLEIKF